MAQRYNPDYETIYHPYEELPEIKVFMEECKDGEWVKLETYVNEQKRMQKQIAKLKAKIKLLEN